MKGETKLKTPERTNRSAIGKSLRKRFLTPVVCSVLAGFGILGGVAAIFAGMVLVIIHGLIAGDTTFDRIGTFLLIVAIPMILAGAIFLDEITEGR